MVQNIRHTGIVVDDLDRSLAFYHDLLGFQVTKKMEETGRFIDQILGLEAVVVTTVKMASPGGQLIELLKFHSHPGARRSGSVHDIGLTHIAFTVSDLDSEFRRLEGDGISFISEPQTSPDGYARVAFCRAPEGTFIELVEEVGG